MASVYTQNDTYQALTEHLSGGEIGCLKLENSSSKIAVYVMYGGIVGAISKTDDAQLVRRLRLANHLNDAQVRVLSTVMKADKPLLNFLFEMLSEETLHQFLYEQFLENIATFLSSTSKCQYEKLQAVFIDNLQMGHDTEFILNHCSKLAESAASVDLDLRLACAKTQGCLESDETILRLFGKGQTLADIIDDVPMGHLATRAQVSELMHRGFLVHALMNHAPDEVPEIVGQRTVYTDTPPAPRKKGRGFINKQTIVPTPPSPPQPNPAPQRGPQPLVTAESDHWEDPIVEEPTEEIDRSTVLSDTGAPPRRIGNIVANRGPSAFDEDEALQTEEVDDESTERSATGAGNLNSLEDWFDHKEDEDVDVMEAFQDYDEHRGSGQGGFSSAQHHLDRIDVGGLDVETEEEELIVASDEEVTLFSVPVAHQKVDVANEVMHAIASAFDEHQGLGAGQQIITQLIESVPYAMKPLFVDVKADKRGSINNTHILNNLQEHPMAQQRRILHQGMMALIDSGLSMAADELPDKAIDNVLEQVQGYRQKLGT